MRKLLMVNNLFNAKQYTIMATTLYTHFIGIDVAQDTLDIAVHQGAQPVIHMQVSNDLKGFRSVIKQAKLLKIALKNALFALEHTGVYAYALLNFLHKKQYAAWAENPTAIKRSLGLQRGKNDRVDAERIAEYAYRFSDRAKLWQPDKQVIQALKALLKVRSQLLKYKTGLKKSLSDCKKFIPETYSMIAKEQQAAIRTLEKQIDALDKKIQQALHKDEDIKHQYALITSIPGIGPLTASQLLIVSNGFSKMHTGKQFACYSGVAPFEHTSGTSLKGKTRVSHMANKQLKCLLHLASMVVIKLPGHFKDYYERQLKKGKHKMSVLNAIRNKLLLCVCACIRDNQAYNPGHVYQAA